MNQEKEMMQIVNSADEYLAPKIKVVEIKARRMVCQSPTGGTEDSSEGSTSAWFKG